MTTSPAPPQLTTPITVPRRYPGAPLVGVGVAVYNAQGQVLLVQRGRPPGQGTWGLPGGLIDLGESLAEAAVREVMEEVGVIISLGKLVTTYETILRDEAGKLEYHYVVLDYWAEYVDGAPTAQDDAAAVAWVSVAELTGYIHNRRQLEILEQTYAAWRAAQPPQTQTTAQP